MNDREATELERKISRDIQVALGALPGVCCWRNPIGVATYGQHRVPYGCGGPGAPDLVCEVLVGRLWVCLWLEVKTDVGRLKPDQARWHAAAVSMHRHVAVVRSVSEALAVVRGFQS